MRGLARPRHLTLYARTRAVDTRQDLVIVPVRRPGIHLASVGIEGFILILGADRRGLSPTHHLRLRIGEQCGERT